MTRRFVINIVQTEVGHDDVKGGIGERHLLRRLADERAERGDAFEIDVALGRGGGVSAHIDIGPYIDAGRVAGTGDLSDAFCRSASRRPRPQPTSRKFSSPRQVCMPSMKSR